MARPASSETHGTCLDDAEIFEVDVDEVEVDLKVGGEPDENAAANNDGDENDS